MDPAGAAAPAPPGTGAAADDAVVVVVAAAAWPRCAYTARDVLLSLRRAEAPEVDSVDAEAAAGRLALRRASARGVGGNRLRVLCDLHRPAPKAAADGGSDNDDSDVAATTDSAALRAAARQLVDVMRGEYGARFVLVAAGDADDDDANDSDGLEGEGQELPPETALDFVHRLLLQPPVDDGGSAAAANAGAIVAAPPSCDEDPRKRRRRSSLLRRSVTEDGVAVGVKRALQENLRAWLGGGGASASFRSPDAGAGSAAVVTELQPLDVLFNASVSALLTSGSDAPQTGAGSAPSTPAMLAGNNRLSVLVGIKAQPFRGAPPETQQATLEELYRTVTEFWGGRFLAQPPAAGPGGGTPPTASWVRLDMGAAKEGLARLLNPDHIPETADPAASAASQGSGRRRSSLLRLRNSLLTLDFLRNSHPPPEGAGGSGGSAASHPPEAKLRSAAVASLQRRRKRQGLTSRIRSLTTRVLSGGSGTGAARDPVLRAQQDRFAEANFDTAPPGVEVNSNDGDEYGYGDLEDAPDRRTFMPRTPSQGIMPPPPPQPHQLQPQHARQEGIHETPHNASWDHPSKGEHAEEEEDDNDDGDMLAVLKRPKQAKAAAAVQQPPSGQTHSEGTVNECAGGASLVTVAHTQQLEQTSQSLIDDSSNGSKERSLLRASDRFSSIGVLEEGQLENLLTGLDVSETDLDCDFDESEKPDVHQTKT